jgi:hypothetical protein
MPGRSWPITVIASSFIRAVCPIPRLAAVGLADRSTVREVPLRTAGVT